MTTAFIPIIPESTAAALDQPTGTALGLPGRAYFDAGFYESERKSIFAAGWMTVGFASQVPKPGDVAPISIAGWELVMVRGRDGGIQVFHNVCRHRGMKVVGKACNARTLACPYHYWTYGLDGKLLATPAIGGPSEPAAPGIDPAQLSLVPVASGVWFDFVFVNIDGNAPPLDQHLKPVRERVEASFDLSQVKLGEGGRNGTRGYPVNWKVVLEGSIEDYHLPFVHKAFNHSKDYHTEEGGAVYAGFSSKRGLDEAAKRYGALDNAGVTLPTFPAMKKSGIAETVVLFIYPNAVLSCTPTYVSTSFMIPDGPEHTTYVSQTNFVGDGATDPAYKHLREDNAAFWNEVFNEDDGIWKTIQHMSHVREGLGLPTRFSPHWERALHAFQKYVAGRLQAAQGEGAH